MILKMNFNFKFKDSLPRQTRQSATSQPCVIRITRVISRPERFQAAGKPTRKASFVFGFAHTRATINMKIKDDRPNIRPTLSQPLQKRIRLRHSRKQLLLRLKLRRMHAASAPT